MIAVFGKIAIALAVLAFAFRRTRAKESKDLFGKFIDRTQLDSPDIPGSHTSMQPSTLSKLAVAQQALNVFFNFLSGVRSAKHNASDAVKGAKDSAHLYGYAADIDTRGEDLERILRGLYDAGFRRFGIGTDAIHVDDDPKKKTPAMWYYGDRILTPETLKYLRL